MASREQLDRFLEALSSHGIVTRAAKETDNNVHTLYHLRRNDDEFREAWDDALACGKQMQEDAARQRAFYGDLKTVWYQGAAVGTELVKSDMLAKMFLEADHPDRFRKDVSIDVQNKLMTMSDEELNAEIEKKLKRVGTQTQGS